MAIDQNIRKQVMEILSDPMNLPSDFWEYDIQNWQKEAPVFPISQVFGFNQFTAQVAAVATAETRTSSVYGDLATVGPQLTGLADGKYVFVWAAAAKVATAGVAMQAQMALQINGTSAPATSSASVALSQVAGYASVVAFDIATLSNNGSSTVTVKYLSADGITVSTFQNRALLALRYGNV